MGRSPACEERPRAQWCRRWPPTEQERTEETGRGADPGRPKRRSENRKLEAASLHHWARGPTSGNGTTPDNQRSILRPLPCGRAECHTMAKSRGASPRATARVRRSVLRAVVQAQGLLKIRPAKRYLLFWCLTLIPSDISLKQ